LNNFINAFFLEEIPGLEYWNPRQLIRQLIRQL